MNGKRLRSAAGVVSGLTGVCIAAMTAPVQGQAVLTSWRTTSSTQIAQVREYVGGSLVPTWPSGGLTNLGGGQDTPAQSDIQQIWSTPNDVFVYSNDLASHTMGPWYQNNAGTLSNANLFGRWPTSTNLLFKIPRNPSAAATKSATGGDVAVMVNGVIMFNYGDAYSWDNSANTESSTTGDGLWNRLAYPVEGPTFDPAKAHQPGNGTYHYHSNPYGIRYLLGDNVTFTPGDGSTLDSYTEDTSSLTHSPIIGWAYDGYPVYGPYGYSSALDSGSAIRRMVSGYVLRDGSNGTVNLSVTGRITLPQWSADAEGRSTTLASGEYGPNVSSPNRSLGRYAEDYDHLADTGNPSSVAYDLDRYNGRTCVTPEYPGGTYAYFVSIAADGTPAFPNIIGAQYYGTKSGGRIINGTPPVSATLNFTAVQDVVGDGGASELNYTINPTRGATDQALGRFSVVPNSNGHVTHTAFTINIGSAAGVSNLKLYRTTDPTYTSPVQFGTTQNPSGGSVLFSGTYTSSAATYFWLRGDIAANASGDFDPRLSSVSVTGANLSSFGGNDALSNGAVTLPVAISGFRLD